MIRFLRWFLFWPVALCCGQLATTLVIGFGGLAFGSWWLPGCAIIAASAFVQPVTAFMVASYVAPRMNKAVAWSILAPYMLLSVSAMWTVFKLLFGLGVYSINGGSLFTSVPPWWIALCVNIGFMLGYGAACTLWEEWSKSHPEPHTEKAVRTRGTTIHQHEELLMQK